MKSSVSHQRSALLKMAVEKSSALLKDRLFLYNTLSKDKQLFTAIDTEKNTVSFYR